MLQYAHELKAVTIAFYNAAISGDKGNWTVKPQPGKWSKNEIIGHLTDSAFNNIQRFIRATYEENFKVVYYQNEWVNHQHYNSVETNDILELWKLLNLQIARILEHYPADRKGILCDTGKDEIQLHTIEFLAVDYIDHLKHHLNQLK